ncbi:hypothetical protein IFM89_008129 [Coptis chinensis]|uniref:Uncharacterized protein n=1 Tax=Coptis chinensis TaxID=261450 RepID=A0A835MHR6_9MAGN|nr:hypothetical protein IFM89_008129 [Coptis chinensis]
MITGTLQLNMQMESSLRMLYNTNELLMRRKLEQAKLQQEMELHSRKLMGLHLFYGNKHHRRNLSPGTGSVPSPIHSHTYVNQNFMIPTSSPGQSSPMTQLDNCAISCATSLSLSTITDNVSKPQAELDHGDNDTEENSKHGDNNTHVRPKKDTGVDKKATNNNVALELKLLEKFREDIKKFPDDKGLEEFIGVPLMGMGKQDLAGFAITFSPTKINLETLPVEETPRVKLKKPTTGRPMGRVAGRVGEDADMAVVARNVGLLQIFAGFAYVQEWAYGEICLDVKDSQISLTILTLLKCF